MYICKECTLEPDSNGMALNSNLIGVRRTLLVVYKRIKPQRLSIRANISSKCIFIHVVHMQCIGNAYIYETQSNVRALVGEVVVRGYSPLFML